MKACKSCGRMFADEMEVCPFCGTIHTDTNTEASWDPMEAVPAAPYADAWAPDWNKPAAVQAPAHPPQRPVTHRKTAAFGWIVSLAYLLACGARAAVLPLLTLFQDHVFNGIRLRDIADDVSVISMYAEFFVFSVGVTCILFAVAEKGKKRTVLPLIGLPFFADYAVSCTSVFFLRIVRSSNASMQVIVTAVGTLFSAILIGVIASIYLNQVDQLQTTKER